MGRQASEADGQVPQRQSAEVAQIMLQVKNVLRGGNNSP